MKKLMRRRGFLHTIGGAGMFVPSFAAAAETRRTGIYMLNQYHLRAGSQPGRVHEFFSKSLLPAMNKVHPGPKLFLEALIAPHMPQMAAIIGFESVETMRALHQKIVQTPEVVAGMERLEAGPEPPFEHVTATMLEATDYSPEIPPTPPDRAPRIFELRVYHSPTWRQLKALHERFAGPEIKIFHRVGVHPILYTSTVVGANMPNLTYVIPFDSLAAREKAWTAFAADPEWIKVRQESIDRHGQISSVIQISLYRATAYSPVK
jgi:hypothetical protein